MKPLLKWENNTTTEKVKNICGTRTLKKFTFETPLQFLVLDLPAKHINKKNIYIKMHKTGA